MEHIYSNTCIWSGGLADKWPRWFRNMKPVFLLNNFVHMNTSVQKGTFLAALY